MTSVASTLPEGQGALPMVEAVIVIVMMGIVLRHRVPQPEPGSGQSDVRSARTNAVGLYYQARASALMTGRFTTLTFSGNQAVITATPRLSRRRNSRIPSGNVEDLGLSLSSHRVRRTPGNALTVDPRGLGSSAATTVYFARNGQQDSMMVTGFGRVIR